MAGLAKIILQRLLLGIATLFAVSIIIFVAVNALPGDFAQSILGQGATPESVAAIREQLGLNEGPVTRYLKWLVAAIQGDLGVPMSQALFQSFTGSSTGGDVITVFEQIVPRLKNTLFLAGVSAAISVPLAVTLGILTALYRNTAFDKAMNVTTLSAISSPEFFLAYILILFLAVLNPIFPSLSNIFDGMPFAERLEKSMLPALTLTLVVTAHMMLAADAEPPLIGTGVLIRSPDKYPNPRMIIVVDSESRSLGLGSRIANELLKLLNTGETVEAEVQLERADQQKTEPSFEQ